MNSKQAKNINLVDFLTKLEIRFYSIQSGCGWYLSPFRKEEKKPSFKVNVSKNVWIDYGLAKGGNIIDFTMMYFSCNVSEALNIIESKSKLITNSIIDLNPSILVHDGKLEIQSIEKLTNKSLIFYICSFRGISYKIASNYLKEIEFTNGNGKKYFAAGFKNDLEGYELRNKYFKGGTSPKSITTIKGTDNKTLNIFEGFIDFLSAMEYKKTLFPVNDTIVLNSLVYLPQITSSLSSYNYVNLFLDNDESGKKAVTEISKYNSNIRNFATLMYSNHKDFNDFFLFTSKKFLPYQAQ